MLISIHIISYMFRVLLRSIRTWRAGEGEFDETVFYGLQYYLKEYLQGQAFTKQDVDAAEELMNGVFGRKGVFRRENFDYILERHGGRLPVRIKAVPEGMSVPVRNVLMTIENTDPSCFWLTNFLETLLMQVWYPLPWLRSRDRYARSSSSITTLRLMHRLMRG